MLVLEMKVFSLGELILEVEIVIWLVVDGDYVEKDQVIVEVDLDKVILEFFVEQSGIIMFKVVEGDVVKVGQVVCLIDIFVVKLEGVVFVKEESKVEEVVFKVEEKKEVVLVLVEKKEEVFNLGLVKDLYVKGIFFLVVVKVMEENNVFVSKVVGIGKDGCIIKQDVVVVMFGGFDIVVVVGWGGICDQNCEKMFMFCCKVVECLVFVKQEMVMLMIFNEVDMKLIMDFCVKYKDQFFKIYDVNFGFMFFFMKVVMEVFNFFLVVNVQIDGNEMVFYNYVDIGIVVFLLKGLMVLVVCNVEVMLFVEIEKEIK